MSLVDLDFAPAEVDVEYFPNGSMILRSPQSLLAYERQVGNSLRRAAKQVPSQVFLAERNSKGAWIKITYAEAQKMTDSISQSLLDLPWKAPCAGAIRHRDCPTNPCPCQPDSQSPHDGWGFVWCGFECRH